MRGATGAAAAPSSGAWPRVDTFAGPLGEEERRFLAVSGGRVRCVRCARVWPARRQRVLPAAGAAAGLLLCASAGCDSSALVRA